jgi:hypothetical protein
MPPPRRVSDQALLDLLAAGGATWRHSALTAALCRISGCSERTARRTLAQAVHRGIVSTRGGVYRPASEPRQTGSNSRPSEAVSPPARARVVNTTGRRAHVDRHHLLVLIQSQSWRYTDLINAVCQTFGCHSSTARWNLRLALTYGYIRRGDHGYQLTAEADAQLAQYGRLIGLEGVRFARFCSGRPGRHLNG